MQTRLFYVDDSGTVDTGWVVYSWVECALSDWREGLRDWLDFRKQLYRDSRIPPAYELHCSKFLNGRGNPSTDHSWNRHKRNRRTVVRDGLTVIGRCPQLSVGAVYRQTAAKGADYAAERASVYEALVNSVDTRLASQGNFGLIFMDGNGSDSTYYDAHRGLKLARRHVMEDPLFQPAHRSQWVQMADLLAYAAYQSRARQGAKRYSWHWYERLVGDCDVNSGPMAV